MIYFFDTLGFFSGFTVRQAQIVAKGQPITVACMIKATTAPPGLSFNSRTNQGKNIAIIDISMRLIFIMRPFSIALVNYSPIIKHFAIWLQLSARWRSKIGH